MAYVEHPDDPTSTWLKPEDEDTIKLKQYYSDIKVIYIPNLRPYFEKYKEQISHVNGIVSSWLSQIRARQHEDRFEISRDVFVRFIEKSVEAANDPNATFDPMQMWTDHFKRSSRLFSLFAECNDFMRHKKGKKMVDAYRSAIQLVCKFALDHLLIEHCRTSGVRLDRLDKNWLTNLEGLDRTIQLYVPCCAVHDFDGVIVQCEVNQKQHHHNPLHQSSKTTPDLRGAFWKAFSKLFSSKILHASPCRWEGPFAHPNEEFPQILQDVKNTFESLDKENFQNNYRFERLNLLKDLHESVEFVTPTCMGCFKDEPETPKLKSGPICGHRFCEDCWEDIHEAAERKHVFPASCPCCGESLH